ncbi:MAG TPA: right-handed parallel beta-helix repeat-containing protein, partial [Tepidisphaeraceae bacterium]|nr:right-handed parallel beta-helix repeat-containing protein [Tepidisphaeraceae bacterium]
MKRLLRIKRVAFLMVGLMWSTGVYAATMEAKGFDSASIAAAIQQAATGDTVLLPAGQFELAEPVRPKSGVKLLGAGQEKTRLVYRGTKPAVLVDIVGCQDVELAQLTLDGQANPLVHQGISGSDSRRLWIHHVTICNLIKSDTFGPHGILFSGHNPTMERGVTDSTISDCRLENIGLGAEYGGGIRLNWGCVRNRVQGNVVRNTGRGGIFGDHSAELIIRNNTVSGSGGEGLGIEIWGGCPRSLIEDNVVDHWISVDQGNQSAVRRNIVGTEDGTLKGYGIEIIARDMVVTDNIVKKGARIGLSVSNQPVKNNVYWAYNTVSDCIQWGAQLQGERGGIAQHYFYRCVFEKTVHGDSRATYKQDSGHGFRTNSACRNLVLEECTFRDNGGLGLQLGGQDVDGISLIRCEIAGNGNAAVSGPTEYTTLEFADCKVQANQSNQLPPPKPFAKPAPQVELRVPEVIRAGEVVRFQCVSVAGEKIVERLWDCGHGIPEVSAEATHTYEQPGKY